MRAALLLLLTAPLVAADSHTAVSTALCAQWASETQCMPNSVAVHGKCCGPVERALGPVVHAPAWSLPS